MDSAKSAQCTVALPTLFNRHVLSKAAVAHTCALILVTFYRYLTKEMGEASNILVLRTTFGQAFIAMFRFDPSNIAPSDLIGYELKFSKGRMVHTMTLFTLGLFNRHETYQSHLFIPLYSTLPPFYLTLTIHVRVPKLHKSHYWVCFR